MLVHRPIRCHLAGTGTRTEVSAAPVPLQLPQYRIVTWSEPNKAPSPDGPRITGPSSLLRALGRDPTEWGGTMAREELNQVPRHSVKPSGIEEKGPSYAA